jgi:hypothetical protein
VERMLRTILGIAWHVGRGSRMAIKKRGAGRGSRPAHSKLKKRHCWKPGRRVERQQRNNYVPPPRKSSLTIIKKPGRLRQPGFPFHSDSLSLCRYRLTPAQNWCSRRPRLWQPSPEKMKPWKDKPGLHRC